MKKFLFGFSLQPNNQTITNSKYFMAKPSRCKICLTSFPWSSRNNASFKSTCLKTSARWYFLMVCWTSFFNFSRCFFVRKFISKLVVITPCSRYMWNFYEPEEISIIAFKQEILISLKILWRITKSYNFNTNIKNILLVLFFSLTYIRKKN